MILLACLAGALVMVKRTEGPPAISLESVHFDTERYEGQRVRVSGVVREFQDTGPPYYVLEDAKNNRILLRASPSALAARVGAPLTAVGVVGFDETTGTYLNVEMISESP